MSYLIHVRNGPTESTREASQLTIRSILRTRRQLFSRGKGEYVRMQVQRALTVTQLFAILFTESAGTTSLNHITDYNTALSLVKYGEYVHTQVRRFIIVRRKREFCYAV
jgi:hypothetical protein